MGKKSKNKSKEKQTTSKIIESGNYYLDKVINTNNGMDDDNFSNNLVSTLESEISAENILDSSVDVSNIYDSLYHSNNIRQRDEIYSTSKNGGNIFNKTFRFGLYNPYGTINTTREFIFFTKPDLHLYQVDEDNGKLSLTPTTKRNPGLNSFFWQDLFDHKDRIIRLLQASYSDPNDPYNHLLQNTVNSNLEVPSLNAPSIETSTNTYGVSLTYRGSSEESDDGPEFSLEFKDDKYLNVYTFFRAYEEYETLKKHGVIRPQKAYIINKILHDQFSVYKFIVDEDMETIIYWGKYYGVYPTSLPRDAFSSNNFQDGLTFSINFKAAFYEDMRPEILTDFNTPTVNLWDTNSKLHRIDIYNDTLHRIDNRAAKVAYVEIATGSSDPRASQNPNGYYYKLAWKGDDIS